MRTFCRIVLALAVYLSLAFAAHAVPFSKADKNKDGFVTFSEAERVYPDLNEVHFNKFIDGPNGTVTKKAWPGLDNFYRMMYRSRR
jgi:hypothetical protein